MYCKNCGNALEEKTKYCPFCGAPIEAPEKTATEDPVIPEPTQRKNAKKEFYLEHGAEQGLTKMVNWGWVGSFAAIALLVGFTAFNWARTGFFYAGLAPFIDAIVMALVATLLGKFLLNKAVSMIVMIVAAIPVIVLFLTRGEILMPAIGLLVAFYWFYMTKNIEMRYAMFKQAEEKKAAEEAQKAAAKEQASTEPEGSESEEDEEEEGEEEPEVIDENAYDDAADDYVMPAMRHPKEEQAPVRPQAKTVDEASEKKKQKILFIACIAIALIAAIVIPVIFSVLPAEKRFTKGVWNGRSFENPYLGIVYQEPTSWGHTSDNLMLLYNNNNYGVFANPYKGYVLVNSFSDRYSTQEGNVLIYFQRTSGSIDDIVVSEKNSALSYDTQNNIKAVYELVSRTVVAETGESVVLKGFASSLLNKDDEVDTVEVYLYRILDNKAVLVISLVAPNMEGIDEILKQVTFTR